MVCSTTMGVENDVDQCQRRSHQSKVGAQLTGMSLSLERFANEIEVSVMQQRIKKMVTIATT